MKSLYLAAALCVGISGLYAQTPLEKAEYLYEDRNYTEAALSYEKLVEKIKKPELKANTYAKIGNCYYYQQKFQEAKQWYQKAVQANATLGNAFLKYGDLLIMNGDYRGAANEYEKAKNLDSSLIRVVEPRLKTCVSGSKHVAKPSVLIHQLEQNINSKMNDYAPVYFRDRIVYTTSMLNGSDKPDNFNSQGFSRLWYGTYDGDGNTWKPTEKLPDNINTPYHNGTFTFDPKTNTGFYTQCNGLDGKGKSCKIYFVIYNPSSNSWGTPEALSFCSDEFNCLHPMLSADGKTLYFSSDKPEGYGGLDLYRSMRSGAGNAFSEPFNLGRNVNSGGDEVFPTIGGDSLLYFSSNGREGIGGYDIFSVKIEKNSFSKPTLLMPPVNSSADDMSYTPSPTNKFEGFYVSNRPGGFGMDDIYFHMLDPKFKTVAGYIREEKTNLPVANAKLKLRGTDGQDYEAQTDATGKFFLKNVNPEAGYSILASSDGYFSNSGQVKPLNLSSNKDQTDILKERNNIGIALMKITKEEIKLDNIYYEYGKYTLTEPSKVELMTLVKLLKETPNVKVMINAHTDEQGSDKFNLKLSDKRAESVVLFLVENGIERFRLSFKGWGESNPVNKGAKTEEEHAANRRTTFSVIGVTQ